MDVPSPALSSQEGSSSSDRSKSLSGLQAKIWLGRALCSRGSLNDAALYPKLALLDEIRVGTDEAAHAGNYSAYLRALNQADCQRTRRWI